MEQACGWLRWPPDAFWNATLAEVAAGASGFIESKSGKSPRARLERLAALHAEIAAAREEGDA